MEAGERGVQMFDVKKQGCPPQASRARSSCVYGLPLRQPESCLAEEKTWILEYMQDC